MTSAVFLIVAVAMSAAALFAVAYPLLSRGRSAQPVELSAQEQLEELIAQRDAAYQALRELNFDHQVGKITDEDFAAFETNLKLNAADTLRRLDAWEAETDDELDELSERLVAERKTLLTTDRVCSQCGRPAEAEDKFCAGCGAGLPFPAPAETAPVSLACPQCARAISPSDRFCPACGHPLAEPVGIPAP